MILLLYLLSTLTLAAVPEQCDDALLPPELVALLKADEIGGYERALAAMYRTATDAESYKKQATETFDIDQLGTIGKQALERSLVRTLGNTETSYPAREGDRNYVVFYSSKMCLGCEMALPTYAKLSQFLPRTDFYYTQSRELLSKDDVKFTPVLVLHTRNGRVYAPGFAGSTRDYWAVLKLLSEVGTWRMGDWAVVKKDGVYTQMPVQTFADVAALWMPGGAQ